MDQSDHCGTSSINHPITDAKQSELLTALLRHAAGGCLLHTSCPAFTPEVGQDLLGLV